MPEAILIIFAAVLIYYVATRVAPKGLLFKLKKEEESLRKKITDTVKNVGTPREAGESQLVDFGQELFNKGRLGEAEKKFIEAIKEDPACAPAYHFLGMIYLRQKEYNGAIAVLEKACKLDLLNDTALNNLGLAYHNVQKYQEAVEHFEKSIHLNDKIAHRYVNLGLAYQGLKDWEKAAIAFENACKIHENAENLTLLAQNYLKLKDDKLALKAVERLLVVDSGNTWAKRQQASLKN